MFPRPQALSPDATHSAPPQCHSHLGVRKYTCNRLQFLLTHAPARAFSYCTCVLPPSNIPHRSWLSAQERRQTSTSSTQTTSPPSAPAMTGTAVNSGRIIIALLALVVVLVGTNAYSYSENRAWKVSRNIIRGCVHVAGSTAVNSPGCVVIISYF